MTVERAPTSTQVLPSWLVPAGPAVADGASCATTLANTVAGWRADDRLRTTEDLVALLRDVGLETSTELTATDVADVRRLRSQLRGLIAADDVGHVVGALNRMLAAATPRLSLGRSASGGSWHWELTPAAEASVSARLELAIAPGLLALVAQHGLERFRSCAADRCTGMFADTSRNGRRRFCEPTACGVRTHVAAHRARSTRQG